MPDTTVLEQTETPLGILQAKYKGLAGEYSTLINRQFNENIGLEGVTRLKQLQEMAAHGLFKPGLEEDQLQWREEVLNMKSTDQEKARKIELTHKDELLQELGTLERKQLEAKEGFTAAEQARWGYLGRLRQQRVFVVREPVLV